MEMLIDLAIQETNEALDASRAQTQLRLVHAYRHPSYVETGGSDALNDITAGFDGMGDVAGKRNTYGADMVALIVDIDNFCGLAWRSDLPYDGYMFSVTDWSCATGGYTFGHELGHNFVSHAVAEGKSFLLFFNILTFELTELLNHVFVPLSLFFNFSLSGM